MKLLVDMNLPPEWIGRLAQRGYEAVHWSTVGAVTASDHEILTWATDHGFVVLTHDLDFAAILAATSDRAPSVVQLRIHDVLAETHSRPSWPHSPRTLNNWSPARSCPLTRPAHGSGFCPFAGDD